jgi:hypothetical protein
MEIDRLIYELADLLHTLFPMKEAEGKVYFVKDPTGVNVWKDPIDTIRDPRIRYIQAAMQLEEAIAHETPPETAIDLATYLVKHLKEVKYLMRY